MVGEGIVGFDAEGFRIAVERFEADDGVGERVGEVLDLDRLGDEAAGAGRAPAFDDGAADHGAARLGGVGAVFRQDDVEREAHLALRGGLPEEVVGVGLDLADLEEGGADFVRGGGGRQREGSGEPDEDAGARRFITRRLPEWVGSSGAGSGVDGQVLPRIGPFDGM